MNILITGSSGFLGSAFMKYLKKRNVSFKKYDRVLAKIPRDTDVVVHFGGLTPFSPGFKNDDDFTSANVEGTQKLLSVLEKHKKLKRFISIGTVAEYGFSNEPVSETSPEDPQTAYGKSKLAQARLVEAFALAHNVPTFNLRIFNVIGVPSKTGARPMMFESLLQQFASETPSLSNVDDMRDLVDIEDISSAIYSALKAKTKNTYEVINIASGAGTSLKKIADQLGHELKKSYSVNPSTRSPSISVGTNTKARRVLQWKPKLSVQKSIQRLARSRS